MASARIKLDTVFIVILAFLLLNFRKQLFIVILIAISLVVLVFTLRISKKLSRFTSSDSVELRHIDRMSGTDFELYVAQLLRRKGFRNIKLTEKYDYGVDITAEKDSVRWGVQVKRSKGIVKAIAVRQVVTALRKYNCDRAMLVTNNSYSKYAKELARVNDCKLIDRNALEKLLYTCLDFKASSK